MAVPQDLLDAMPTQLASDIAHDHGLGTVVKDVIAKIVRGNPAPDADEDSVVATFDELMKKHDEYSKVLEQRQFFELPSNTETLPSSVDWSLPDDFAFVHDAGPKLFKLLDKKNYITYGTILDSASKPRGDAIYVQVPPEVPTSVFQDIGFKIGVGPLKLENVSDTSVKAILTYNGVQYDMAGAKRMTPGAVAQPKEMGKPAGYLASVATVKDKIGSNIQPDLYIIGKALGDALQVMSVRDSGVTAPRLIHNTEDRLNFVRCRVFDVPAIHVKRKTAQSPVRICEFIPSRAMITDTPEIRFNRYLTKLKGFLQVTASNYDRIVKQFTDPQTTLAPRLSSEYCAEAVRQLRLLKIGTLFHFMAWTVYYDSKKASPTDEDAKAIAMSHDILSASAKRLSPYGSITRINGLDYVQKFIVCHAPPDDCDLGGFPIVGTGGTDLRSRATDIVNVLLGTAPLTTIKGGETPLKIDVAGLQTLLTEFGIQTEALVAPPAEVSIPSGGGAGFGIRGTYYFDLVQDAKSGKSAPSRVLVGGQKRKREEDLTAPDGKRARLERPDIGTTDASLFEWYVFSKAPDVTPSEVLFHAKSGTNSEVFDLGLVSRLEDEGIVAESGPNRQRCIAVWNAFLCFVNRGLLDVGKSNPWVSLHGQAYEDPLLSYLDDQEDDFLNPPTPVVSTPERKTRRSGPRGIFPTKWPIGIPVGASRLLPSPFPGLSDKDWTDAVRELEARYTK